MSAGLRAATASSLCPHGSTKDFLAARQQTRRDSHATASCSSTRGDLFLGYPNSIGRQHKGLIEGRSAVSALPVWLLTTLQLLQFISAPEFTVLVFTAVERLTGRLVRRRRGQFFTGVKHYQLVELKICARLCKCLQQTCDFPVEVLRAMVSWSHSKSGKAAQVPAQAG